MIFERLQEKASRDLLAEELLSKGEEAYEFPKEFTMSFKQFQKFYDLHQLWVATGKRHLLSELMAEPEEAWAVVLEIEKIYSMLKEEQKRT